MGKVNIVEYVSMKDTNKLMRKVLKESFPGVKFSIRGSSYAGGASTTINWTDGPNEDQVDGLISVFKGSYFDGMIDYKGNRYAWLDGNEVSFATDFIFYNRDYSRKTELRMIGRLMDKYTPADACPLAVSKLIDDYHAGKLHNFSPMLNVDCHGMLVHSWTALIRKALRKHTFVPFAQLSPTLARVSFKGDDGYGAGCVGRDGNGEGYGGYPKVNGIPN